MRRRSARAILTFVSLWSNRSHLSAGRQQGQAVDELPFIPSDFLNPSPSGPWLAPPCHHIMRQNAGVNDDAIMATSVSQDPSDGPDNFPRRCPRIKFLVVPDNRTRPSSISWDNH